MLPSRREKTEHRRDRTMIASRLQQAALSNGPDNRLPPPPKRERPAVIFLMIRHPSAGFRRPARGSPPGQTHPLAHVVATFAPIIARVAEHDEPIRRRGCRRTLKLRSLRLWPGPGATTCETEASPSRSLRKFFEVEHCRPRLPF